MMKRSLHDKSKRLLSVIIAVFMAVYVFVPVMGYNDSFALAEYKPAAGDYMLFIDGTTLAASIKGSAVGNGANVLLEEGSNVNSMHMVLSKTGAWYYIANKWSGKVLTVQNGKKGSGVNVWQYKKDNSNSQKWKFYSAGNGAYFIKNALGYCLNVSGTVKAGANINVATLNKKSANQKWRLQKLSAPSTKMTLKNIQILSALDTNMLVDLKGGNLEKGARIQLHKNADKTSQKFRVKDAGNGYYYLQNGCSNKYLEVKDGSTANGADTTQWTGRGSSKQQMWRFVPCGGGYYYIQSALGKYLTIDGHVSTLRAVIQVEKGQSIKAQKWKVTSTSLGTNTYINCMKKFVADNRWKNGANWASRAPYLNSGCGWSGCAAYCVDWGNYMYGKSTPRASGVTKHSTVANIKNGDVVHVKDSYGEHWFVVLSRNGNWLKTAEGNVSIKGKCVVSVGTSNYVIKNGKIYSNWAKGYRTVTEIFHFADHMKYDK